MRSHLMALKQSGTAARSSALRGILVIAVVVIVLAAVLYFYTRPQGGGAPGNNNVKGRSGTNTTIPAPYLNNTAPIPGTTLNLSQGQANSTANAIYNYPGFLAYNPANGNMYVENLGGFTESGYNTNISIISGINVTGKLNTSAYLAAAPAIGYQFSLYDPVNRYLYLIGSSYTYVISGNTIIATLQAGFGNASYINNPTAVDADSGYVYIANSNSNTTYIINGTGVSSVGTAGYSPSSLAYNPQDGLVYASPYYASGNGSLYVYTTNATVFSGDSVVSNPTIGIRTADIMADPQSGIVYALSLTDSRIWAIKGSSIENISIPAVYYKDITGWVVRSPASKYAYAVYTSNANSSLTGVALALSGYSLAGKITLPAPVISVYNASNGVLFVDSGGMNGTGTSITAINGTSVIETIGVSGPVEGMLYNPSSGYLYAVVDNFSEGDVLNLLAVKNGTATHVMNLYYFTNMAYNPSNDYLYVSSSPQNVSVISGTTVVANVSA